MDLFDMAQEKNLKSLAPLADRIRPKNLGEVVGQDHLLKPGKFLYRCIAAKRVPSMIFYGPSGTGKTTLAKVIANEVKMNFYQLNAVTSGVKDIREVVDTAKKAMAYENKPNLLFIDEIHRFSKNQQDALLPYVEEGVLTLIGATTENPYFEVNKALLSRSSVLKLESLTYDDIKGLLERTLLDKDQGLGRYNVKLRKDAEEHLIRSSMGDGRRALNALEIAVLSTRPDSDGIIEISLSIVEESTQQNVIQYDKGGDQHYDVISAFIKSIRGSDPDAALHYLAKMLTAGEAIEFIGRRLIIAASEDIGNADPKALGVAVDTYKAVTITGMPEAKLILSQCVTYLATAPKSNASYTAVNQAFEDVIRIHSEVPIHLRDSHYESAASLGHGIEYKYPHSYENNFVTQEYLPKQLKGKTYYYPTQNGYEAKISEVLSRTRKSSRKEE